MFKDENLQIISGLSISMLKCSFTKSMAHRMERYESRLQHRGPPISPIFARDFAVMLLERAKGSTVSGLDFEMIAMNMPVQGTAADVIKLAMVRVDRRLREEGMEAGLILQVHDELIVECPEEECHRVKTLLTEEMEKRTPKQLKKRCINAVRLAFSPLVTPAMMATTQEPMLEPNVI